MGKSGSGKTTLVVQLINERFRYDYGRFYAVCPTFYIQDTFKPIRDLFRREDVYLKPDLKSIKKLLGEIQGFAEYCQYKGLPVPKSLVLFDDMSGSSLIHGCRKGIFAEFAVASRHWGASVIMISHQPQNVDPNYRDNCEEIIVFPSERQADHDWIKNNYDASINKRNLMDKLEVAWKGGVNKEEWGEHFFFLHTAHREKSRFFIDFNKELK